MERFLQTLPRPVLVLGIIIIGIVVFMVMNPPHTICDTQHEQAEAALVGITKPLKVGKQTHPPRINAALETCYQGRSSGSCYDYFQILKSLAKTVKGASSECRAEIYSISDIKNKMEEGIQNLVVMAWGDFPPEPNTVSRYGPLQDSEIALFCYMKSAMVAGVGEAGWQVLRKKVFKLLPGEKVKLPVDPKAAQVQARPAPEVLSEMDIWNRSIFSVRCENYL